jgi:hypothetical protein
MSPRGQFAGNRSRHPPLVSLHRQEEENVSSSEQTEGRVWAAAILALSLGMRGFGHAVWNRCSQLTARAGEVAADRDPNSAASDTKAFIGAARRRGGPATVHAPYLRAPPSSVAPRVRDRRTAGRFPRGGPIPVIYAIAPIGFTPANPATLTARASRSVPTTRR